MSNLNLYKLLKYYSNNYDKILHSIEQREQENHTHVINNLVTELKECNTKFNNAARLRNEFTNNASYKSSVSEQSKLIRNLKREASIRTSKLEKELHYLLLLLPNILHNNVQKNDIILKEKDSELDSPYGIKFTDYISKYCITYNSKTLFYSGELASLKISLINFFLKSNINDNFELVNVPYFVTKEDLEVSGQLPKFEKFLHTINDKIFLIPTSEVVLCKYLQYLDFNNLPYLLCAYSPCFRNEPTVSSNTNKPLLRQGHFEKVETFIVCKKEEELQYFELCINRVEKILNLFGCKYRLLKVGTLEMSSTASLQYDIEVYLPHSDLWIEILSCSSCGMFQLARSSFCKDYTNYVTINCSSFPIERFLAIIIEYFFCPITNKIQLNDSILKVIY